MNGNCKWRSLMGVAAIGVFAFSVSLYGGERLSRVTKDVVPQDNVVAKQTLVGYEIIHSLEALPPQMADRAQPLPLNVAIPIWEVHNDGSPVLDGSVAAGSTCNAVVYRQANDSGYFYPFGKGMDIGNWAANPLNMGNGFVAGDALCAYDTTWYNSVTGFGEGSLQCTLWDGDPFEIYDTTAGGTADPIAGTTGVWSNIRQGGYDSQGCWEGGIAGGTACPPGTVDCTCVDGYGHGLACVDDSDCGLCPGLVSDGYIADPWDEATQTGCAGLYKLVHTMDPPVVIPNDEPWLVCEILDGCRVGWRASWYFAPDVGKGGGAFGCAGVASACTDAVEETYEYGQFNNNSVGTCCDTGAACDHSDLLTSNDCSHPTFCSSGAVDTAGAWYYGAPAYYASFIATAYAMSEAYLSMVPVSSDDPGATIVGNEITMAAGGAKVWLQVEAESWAPVKLKTWQATVNPLGYYAGCAGFLTPWNPPCVGADDDERDASCVAQLGAGSWCDETGAEGYPPTGCCPAFQDAGTTPNLMLGIDAVATSDLYFAWGSTSLAGGLADDGSTFYGGTLVLDVDTTAKGTFDIDFVLGTATFMKDTGNVPIHLIGIYPAKVTVETGRCLYGVGTSRATECIDDCVTKAECDAMPAVNVFDSTKTCDDPWIDCTEDEHCADGDACTVDTCDVIFMCHNDAVTVAADECCDPTCVEGDADDVAGSGTVASFEDDNVCTTDYCVPASGCAVLPDATHCGVPGHTDVADETLCYDGTERACWVMWCQGGVCTEEDVNTVACIDEAECETLVPHSPPDSVDCVADMCECISCETNLPCDSEYACRADLYFDIHEETRVTFCVAEGEKVIADVWMGASLKVITGAQFAVTYDPTCLEFVSISPFGAPFVFEMYEVVDEANGAIYYAVGVDPMGGVGTAGPAGLATITFNKLGDCSCCILDFAGVNPENTYFSDAEGQRVCADGIPSEEICVIDEIDLDCPGNSEVNVDCDMRTADVYWDEPTAEGECYPVDLVCSGVYPDMSVVPQDVVYNGGEFPIGVSSFSCLATSTVCGHWVDCDWTVTVMEQTTLDVVVQLSPIIAADDLCRCIDFELYADCVVDPLVIEKCLRFGGMWDHVGHFTEEFKIPAAGQWFCITAGDQLHTLRSTAYLECVDGVYYAIFKGDPFFSGNWLIGGNLDAFKKDNPYASHDVIDILDFGQFVAHYLDVMNPDTCTRAPDGACLDCILFPDGHADINGDGIVNALDFAFIQMNFMEHSKDACCAGSTADIPTGRTEVSLRELRAMDLSDLSVADLNGDGLLNMDDMAAFMAGDVPSKPSRGNRGAGIR